MDRDDCEVYEALLMKSPTNEDAEGIRLEWNIFHVLLACLACIGGFLFGYDTGVVSGALLLLKDDFSLSTTWQELFVSVTVGAAALFAGCAAFPMDHFGRKPVILFASFVFAVGAVLLGASYNKGMLLAGRLIVGAGIGLASMSVPVYLAEVAPKGIRGRLVTMNVAFITFGQLVAGVIDAGFNYVDDGWRYMLGLAAVPAGIQLVGFLWMPESPRYHLQRHREGDARAVLMRLYSGNEQAVERELESVRRAIEAEDSNRVPGVVLLEILKTPHVRKALFIGCALQFFQQTVGVNSVMYYSGSIIQMSGIRSLSLILWLAAIVAGVNFLFTIPGLMLVDRVGRRTLTLASLGCVILSLLILGAGFLVMTRNSGFPLTHREKSINDFTSMTSLSEEEQCLNAETCSACIRLTSCGYCYPTDAPHNGTCLMFGDQSAKSSSGRCTNGTTGGWAWGPNWCPSQYSWLAVLGLVLYMAAFAPGMGPMPWTVNSEIYPQWARGTAVSLATMTNWLSNLLVSMTFLSLTQRITREGTFFLFAGVCTVALVLFFATLPETKGLSLEQVERKFRRPWLAPGLETLSGWCRGRGREGSYYRVNE